jgi:ABC-2 type transport system ATP-binding protein
MQAQIEAPKPNSSNTTNEPKKEIMVEFQKISKQYQDVCALDEVSFSVHRGEILGYIGPNGAGKTTSLKILVGLIQEFTGNVFINGQNVRDRVIVSKFLGYLPQETGFQEWRTVHSALRTFGLLSGIDSSIIDQKILSVLNFVGLPDVLERKIIHLSGGMKQKLKLAQALIHDPDLIILDEPMNGLDPSSRYQMKNIIKNLADQGKTIIFSSHILSEVQDIANRIAILNKGHLMTLDSPEVLRKNFQVGHDLEIVVKENTPLTGDFGSISEIESIRAPTPSKQIFHIKASVDIDDTISKVWKIVVDQKIKVRNFNLIYPSLEDVYLKYIGGEQQ